MTKKLLDSIGGTPVIRLKKAAKDSPSAIWAKLENLNPGGSVKDRACLSMIERAERENLIEPSKTTIVEASSGNTAAGLAMCCRVKGYPLTVVMPESTMPEKVRTARAFGADIVLTDPAAGLAGAIEKAREMARNDPDCHILDQFSNEADIKTHREKTAKEIADQIPGGLDALVCGFGTGGTITGLGSGLKNIYPGLRVTAVEPEECPVLSGGEPGPHGIPGISPGFVPEKLDRSVIDSVRAVSTEDARRCARKLAREEGILVGTSSGAAFFGALAVSREIGPGKAVLAVFCDGGEAYLETGLYG